MFAFGAAISLGALMGALGVRSHSARRLAVRAQDQGISGEDTAAAIECPKDFKLFAGAPPTAKPVERKDVRTLDAAQLTSLRAGVKKMMDRSTKNVKDPLGWKYQAFIHGVPRDIFKREGKPAAWNTCKHSSFFFLSWHRMEMFFFERILRAESGDPGLTLSYWNFADQRVLPEAFRLKTLPGNAPNPLWWRFRNLKLNNEMKPVPLCPEVVATKEAFEQPVFFVETGSGLKSFGGAVGPPVHFSDGFRRGQIESQPHDLMHGAVGDGSEESMSNPSGAGLDPIFWPIHANIDRAWSCWQRLHPGTEPKMGPWLTEKFCFFDVKKNDDGSLSPVPVLMTGKQIIKTAEQLGYVYDDPCKGFQLPKADGTAQPALPSEVSGVAETAGSILEATVERPQVLGAEPVTVTIHLPSDLQMRIENLDIVTAPAGSIVLNVGGIAVDKPTAAAYEVYLNLPEGASPDPQSMYYVASLSFFGVGNHMHEVASGGQAQSAGQVLSYDVTDVVRQLVASGEWAGDRVSVTFANSDQPECVKPSPAAPDIRARFASLSLAVD